MTHTDIANEIAHTHDGPVTAFVLIARAMRLMAGSYTDPSLVANVLHEELSARGFLKPGHVTPSTEY